MSIALRVLLVEDSQDDADLALREIKKAGYEAFYKQVQTKEDMEAALDERDWDLILSDHSMPRFSSYGALDCLKRKHKDIPLIILSGSIGEEAAVLAMRSGAQDFVMKGNWTRLIVAIERELRESRMRRDKTRVEEALRESEMRFQVFMDKSPAGAVIKDEQGRFLFVNESLCKALGRRLPELLGKTALDVLPKAAAETLRAAEKRVLATGDSSVFLLTIPTSGDRPPIQAQILNFRFEDGSGKQLIGEVAIDVTERMLLEEQLHQSQKMEAFGQLAGGIAHDFNNLLTAIVSPAQMALESMSVQDENRKWLEMIAQAGESATKLVSQLLAFSRKQITQPRPLDVNEVIRDTRKMLGRILGEHIEISTALDAVGKIRADRGQLEQLLLNLAVNARDAMPKGGKLIFRTSTILLEEGHRTEPLGMPAGDYTLITVSDTGTGMSKEIQAHMFEPFFTTKEPGKGTGLGLATCFGIVKQAKGHIACSSEPGKGTTFRIYLPLSKDADVPADSTIPKARMPKGTEAILLVEDEALVRELAARLLREHGYEVLEAASASEALLRLSEHAGSPVALLLTDLVIPEMNGRELAEHIRNLHPQIRTIYTSGYTDDMIVRHGIVDSEVDFILKPFSPPALLTKVRDVLDRRP